MVPILQNTILNSDSIFNFKLKYLYRSENKQCTKDQKSYQAFLKRKFKIVSPRKRNMIMATDQNKSVIKEPKPSPRKIKNDIVNLKVAANGARKFKIASCM
jgi:hypothetical protein